MAHTDRTSRSRGWSRFLLTVLLVACAACAWAPRSAEERIHASALPIIGGTLSGPSQDAVVLLVHETTTSSDISLCSGTLLAPRLVLTARHCVAPVEPVVTCTSDGTAVSGGGVGADYAPSDMYVVSGARRPELGAALPSAIHGVAILDDGAATLCNHDLALLVLERDVPGAPIVPVRLGGDTQPGELTTIVGWGLDETGTLPRARLQRTDQAILAVGPSAAVGLGSSEVLLGRGACSGDSGGPALAASGAVIGLLSRSGSSTGAAPSGDCANDDLGVYTALVGFGPLLLAGYAQAGQEVWLEGQPNPTLAALGEPCNADADCQSSDCSAERRSCTLSCTLGTCPGGFACSAGSECFRAATSGGCTIGERPDSAGPLVLLVLLVASRRARGRRSTVTSCRGRARLARGPGAPTSSRDSLTTWRRSRPEAGANRPRASRRPRRAGSRAVHGTLRR